MLKNLFAQIAYLVLQLNKLFLYIILLYFPISFALSILQISKILSTPTPFAEGVGVKGSAQRAMSGSQKNREEKILRANAQN